MGGGGVKSPASLGFQYGRRRQKNFKKNFDLLITGLKTTNMQIVMHSCRFP